MAKFNIEFDSITKTASIKMDGAVMDNVDCVELYKSCCLSEDDTETEDQFRLNISQSTRDKDNKMYLRHMTSASDGSLVSDRAENAKEELKALFSKGK